MQLKLWLSLLILTSSFAITACKGNLPNRPELDVCMVSAPVPSVDEPEPFQGCLCSKPDGSPYRLTWTECDKHVAFEPLQTERFMSYVLSLEQMVNKGCRLNESVASETIRDLTHRHQILLQR